jgi:2-iminobutanoate/2-iminopropanoate deaminase
LEARAMKILTSVPELSSSLATFGIENAICIEVDNLIVVSGFTGLDLKTGAISEGPFEKHAHEAVDCFELIFGKLGLSLDHVIKVNCFLANPLQDFPSWNDLFKSRFNPPYPCRTTVGAPLVAGLIELEMMAHRTSRRAARIVT